MGSSHRLAVVAAASHARHNHTQPDVATADQPHYNVNALFVSATLCGVLVAVCAGCWRRAAPAHKPSAGRCRDGAGVYTVSADERLNQFPEDMTGPPPAYDSVVHGTVGPPSTIGGLIGPPSPIDGVIGPPSPFDGQIIGPPTPKDYNLQEVVTEPCSRTEQYENGLPSYEVAVLRDTKL